MGREEEKYWARRLSTSFAGWKDTFGLASSHRCLNERSEILRKQRQRNRADWRLHRNSGAQAWVQRHAGVLAVGKMRCRTSDMRGSGRLLGPDRVRQFLPRQHGPVARCGAGWRGQHEDNRKIFLWRLPAQRNRCRRSPIEKARGPLAGEGDGLRPIALHLFTESRKIDREVEGLVVHSRADFAHISEANAEFQQAWKFMRFISARRDPDLVDRAPKAIAGMRVVMTYVG
jgi:hypothetical protein